MLVGGGSYAAPTAGGSGGPLDDVAAGRAAIVLHNGRLLLTPLPPALDNAADTAVATVGAGAGTAAAPGAGALHELDLVLLSSVERSKVGTAVAALVPPATGASGAAGAAEAEEAADALVGMVSFCGRYAAGGGRRFDVVTALAEAEVLPKVRRVVKTGDE